LNIQIGWYCCCKPFSDDHWDHRLVTSGHHIAESVKGIKRLLPSLDLPAVSQAASPESNPDSPLLVTNMVRQYRTIDI